MDHDPQVLLTSLLTQSHVEYALVHHGDKHNQIPMALATMAFMGGTSTQLQALYDHESGQQRPWSMSPGRISSIEHRQDRLGDPRYQRAYMNYYSMELGQLRGNASILMQQQLLPGSKPLVYGLFSGFGHSLRLISDGLDLSSSLLVVEALVVASVDFNQDIFQVLTAPTPDLRHSDLASPETILGRISFDPRFSGVVNTPGVRHQSRIYSNSSSRAALIQYLNQLDISDVDAIIPQLADLSVGLLCATHKPESIAFDCYFSRLPAFVRCLRAMVGQFEEYEHKQVLVRGVWLLFIATYVSQLRPYLDWSLIHDYEIPDNGGSWDGVLSEFYADVPGTRAKYRDSRMLGALRSFMELDNYSIDGEYFYIRAGWKLRTEWSRWTGTGGNRDVSLNIRL